MRYIVLFSVFTIFIASCSKDKFNTVPSLKYKSVNSTVLNQGQQLIFTLSFTDAEGDLSDSIIVQKIVKPCPDGSNSSFIQPYRIPDFPSGKNQQGDLTVNFTYTDVNPICEANDTAIFKFVLKDKAQHRSDTATSEPIIIIY